MCASVFAYAFTLPAPTHRSLVFRTSTLLRLRFFALHIGYVWYALSMCLYNYSSTRQRHKYRIVEYQQ